MTLVDTSVWINHFRRPNSQLQGLLDANQVLMHPMVLGELCCGGLPSRARTRWELSLLPAVSAAPDKEVLAAIESRHWWGKGIGWGDAHLLTSAMTESIPLWSFDKTLSRLASLL
jgi:predicted nucleic acid-binding protein